MGQAPVKTQKEKGTDTTDQKFLVDVEWFAGATQEADVKALAELRASQGNAIRAEYGKITQNDDEAGKWFIRTYWKSYG